MNQRQREAVAWMMYAGGGTNDQSDLITIFRDDPPNVPVDMTDEDIEIIIELICDIKSDIEDKASRKWDAAFRSK